MSDSANRFEFPIVELPPSAALSPDTVVKFLVGQLVHLGRLQLEYAERVVSQVLRRELLGSTRVGHGVAIPHSKSDVVGTVLGIVGRSVAAVNWPGGVDTEPVHVIYLLVTPVFEPQASLSAMEAVARHLKDRV